MIIFNLKKILDQQNISQDEFSRITRIRPNTINDTCNNRIKRISIRNLNSIMKYLHSKKLGISNLIKYKEGK